MSQNNSEQEEFWARMSSVWVAHQEDLDALMQPVLDAVLERANVCAGQDVLDIGCGTGTSTIAAAKLVGPTGTVTGADISAAMVARATASAGGIEQAKFIQCDAAEFQFAQHAFDHAISRFGVMFFSDPVAALANISGALKPGAPITMAAWSSPQENPWFHVPMRAAKTHIGAPPSVDPDDPGPFAFRDIDRVTTILADAGLIDVSGHPLELHLTPRGDLRAVSRQASRIGPASRAIEYFDASQDDVDAINRSIEDAFAAYQTSEGLRVPATINIFTARTAQTRT